MSSRAKAYEKLGIKVDTDVVKPILEQAYKNEEEQIWKNDLFSSPHGNHWATSFHASEFPGDKETACGRKAMYGFMNIPSPKPVNRNGRAVMEAGLDIEDRIVKRFERAGILLSNPPESKHQTSFTDKDIWLSGSSDAIIQIPRTNKPHAVEVKTKYQRVIDEMIAGERSYDPQHKNQLMTYISLCHDYGQELWPELDKCDSGTIIYISRDNPSITFEFQFEYDENWWKEGKKTLEEWKQYFLSDRLPEKPEHFMWSKGPCQYCDYKKHACKPDFQQGVDKMRDSNGILWAEEHYGKWEEDEETGETSGYDYKTQIDTVLERWDQNEHKEN